MSKDTRDLIVKRAWQSKWAADYEAAASLAAESSRIPQTNPVPQVVETLQTDAIVQRFMVLLLERKELHAENVFDPTVDEFISEPLRNSGIDDSAFLSQMNEVRDRVQKLLHRRSEGKGSFSINGFAFRGTLDPTPERFVSIALMPDGLELRSYSRTGSNLDIDSTGERLKGRPAAQRAEILVATERSVTLEVEGVTITGFRDGRIQAFTKHDKPEILMKAFVTLSSAFGL